MTTIVANLECMAADQRMTGGGPMAHVKKIHRVKGNLFGFCGDPVLGMLVLEWLGGKRDKEALYKLLPPDHRNDVELLELSTKGLTYWNGWGAPLPLLDTTFAIGSGAMAALAHARLGASPEEAIKHVFGLDECSGVFLRPQVEPLKPKRA